MSKSFRFGFNADDIEADPEDQNRHLPQNQVPKSTDIDFVPPQLHSLKDMLLTFPSQISFSRSSIKGRNESTIEILRRDLFDIRAQLMAEETNPEKHDVIGLSSDDIVPNVYEGGFKTWECSVDLAEYLCTYCHFDAEGRTLDTTVIELGAGTALPSLAFFRQWLVHNKPGQTEPSSALQLCFADYNRSVLELATVPNLLLASEWFDRYAHSNTADTEQESLERFQSMLFNLNIDVSAISGSWTPQFADLIPPSRRSEGSSSHHTIILASETIYSPSSIQAFTQLLLSILAKAKKQGSNAKAIVAAKRVYFGVGGGTDEFLRVLGELGGRGRMVWETQGAGVGRMIIEVTLP